MARSRRNRRSGILRLLLALIVGIPLFTLLLVLPFRWLTPPTTAFMLHARFAGLGSGAPCSQIDRKWADLDSIAPALPLAVIAAEDQRFPEHHGLDLHAIRAAIEERQQNGRIRGASTLTQQLAKNLWLWPEASWLRKGLEAWLTLALELSWSKRRILEVYLNVAQFGECVFGAQAASRRFFATDAKHLADWQAARLAAVLPAPARYRADRPGDYLQERTRWILSQMRQLGGTGLLQRLE